MRGLGWECWESVQPPADFLSFHPGLGEFPLLFWSGISPHHSDDDGCVVHHVVQVRGCVGAVGLYGWRLHRLGWAGAPGRLGGAVGGANGREMSGYGGWAQEPEVPQTNSHPRPQ